MEFDTIEIPVKPQHEDKWKTLYTLSKSEKKFEEEKILKLEFDNRIYYTVDLLPKVSVYLVKEREEEGIKAEDIKPEVGKLRFPEDMVDLLELGEDMAGNT